MTFPEPLKGKWLAALAQLVKDNSPLIPPEPRPNSLEHARWRDTVNNWKEPDEAAMEAAGIEILAAFHKHIPTLSEDNLAPTISLVASIKDKGRLVDKLIVQIAKAFPETFEKIFANHRRLNGDKPWVDPSDFKGDPLLYLDHTPLLDPFFTWVPFRVPDEQKFSGTWIVAPPGRGKTTLLHSLVLENIRSTASIILMDSKGDLINPFKTYKSIKDHLILIEPSEEHPLALNPFDLGKQTHQTVGLLEYIFSALLEAKMTPLQSTLFRSSLRATLCHPKPSMETFADIVQNGATHALPPDLKRFFEHEFPDTKTYGETRRQIQWRLRLLLENPVISAMFAAPKTKLEIAKEMNAGKIIIINNSKALLGEEGAEFFGRFFIALVLNAAQQRAGQTQEQKRACYFYIDECQNVIRRDEKIATILDECRSQKIAVTLAHQRLAQITPSVLDAMANCAIRYANSDDDAPALAPKLRTTPENLRSRRIGDFAVYARDVGAFNLRVPYNGDLSSLPQMTAKEQAEHRAQMIVDYCTFPEPKIIEPGTTAPPQVIVKHTDTKTEERPPVDIDNISTERRKDW